MAGDASAYATLGVSPGSDAATIEQAYKRLIKQFHPDRAGGDSARAAEINWAYRELRKSRALRDPLELNEAFVRPRQRPQGAMFLALALIALLATLFLATEPGQRFAGRFAPSLVGRFPLRAIAARVEHRERMDEPLHLSQIDAAAQGASEMYRTRDEMALNAASQACHGKFRAHPTVKQLDRCTAFDNAVVQLQDRDPMRDRGPFSELIVTRRQWAEATQLSDDFLSIDSRLNHISVRVQLALAPPAELAGEADLPAQR